MASRKSPRAAEGPTSSAAGLPTDAAMLAALLESSPFAVVGMDPDARVTFWNRTAERIFGLTAPEVLGRVPPFVHGMPSKEFSRFAARVLAGESVQYVHIERSRRNGVHRQLLASTAPLRTPGGEVVGLISFITDIDPQLRAEAQAAANEQRYRTLFYSAPVGIFEADAEGNCVRVNDRWLELAGIERDDAHGSGWHEVVHPDDRKSVLAAWLESAATGREFALEYRYQTPAGKVTWLAGRAVALRDAHGRVTGFVGTVEDITARKHAEGRLEHLAAHDTLTGIANRATFSAQLEAAVEEARKSGGSLAVLFLDLDDFKEVNDQYGHEAGDALLQKTADRLRANARAADVVARYGGDEFVVLLPGLDHGRVRAAVEIVIGRLAETLPAPASIGSAVYPDDGETAQALVAAADAHMYRSKRSAAGPG